MQVKYFRIRCSRTFFVLRRVGKMLRKLGAHVFVAWEHVRRDEREKRVELIQIVLNWSAGEDEPKLRWNLPDGWIDNFNLAHFKYVFLKKDYENLHNFDA